jgi:7,8-dihydropterin-6-yl-methyl-4-(beta-D-ribofuranosyl)aminobenzene 5'-phosphate synthase
MRAMRTIRIHVVTENTAPQMKRGILAEHGLSYFLEAGEAKVLFDTGASALVLENNVKSMALPIGETQAIVLSHGHLDHVGGLEAAQRMIPEAPLFFHPDAPRPKFSGLPGKGHRSDSAFFTSGRFREGGRRIVESRGPLEVAPGVWMTGEVPRLMKWEDTGGRFCLDEGCTIPDSLPDDQALFIPGEKGTIVLLGCAHSGLVSTLLCVRALTNGAPIRFVVGGTHLHAASPERMEKTFTALAEMGVQEIHPCHCTGAFQGVHLCETIGGASAPATAGTTYELEA